MHKNTHSNTLIDEHVVRLSFLPLEPLYEEDTINIFNKCFDEIFSKQNKARRYVDALDMYKLGLIEEIFTPKLISLIYSVVPNPVLYHCHAYEIDGSNSKPHIAGDNFLDGWHRDVDCIHDLSNQSIQHVSLFVYLTDVSDESGAFEVCNKKLGYFPRLFKSSKFYRVTGKKGHSFLFNRTATHRASPNKSSMNRRVLKISFQNKHTFMAPLNPEIKSHEKRFNLMKIYGLLTTHNVLLRSLFTIDDVGNEVVNQKEIKCLIKGNPIGFSCVDAYQIVVKMNVLQEFRGFAKDLVYISRLIIRSFI